MLIQSHRVMKFATLEAQHAQKKPHSFLQGFPIVLFFANSYTGNHNRDIG